jgi:UDP-MurNAc hydroxylase
MRILVTGHAGLLVHAGDSTILCDPWFNPAYFGAWVPFPDNSAVIPEVGKPDFLYVSHLHKDHFDARFLAEHVDKSTTVLLPDFPIPQLREALEMLGFSRFVQTRSGRPVELDGFRVAIATSTSVADGPIGDSAIAVDDGTTRILNQNDCHPRDLSSIRALAPYDVHFLQYSGAIWYPMVYRLDARDKEVLAREKRVRQGQRAMRYIETVGAAHVVPFAGPPAFLDDDLFDLNDFDDDPANIFQDQASFLRTLAENGIDRGHLAVAGTSIDVEPGRFELAQPGEPGEVEAIFEDKRAYLRRYQERRRPAIEAAKLETAAPPATREEVVERLSAWIEPLLHEAPSVRRALGGPILVDVGGYGVLIDPGPGAVRGWRGEQAEHTFFFAEPLLRSLVHRHVEDWVNELFLSCRFEASREGPYNEAVFSFFKCLSSRRMAYLEASLALTRQSEDETGSSPEELWRCGSYLVQRHCPHLGADLSRFGEVDGAVLTCTLHGNRFDLRTGKCLTAECSDLFAVHVDGVTAEALPDRDVATGGGGAGERPPAS